MEVRNYLIHKILGAKMKCFSFEYQIKSYQVLQLDLFVRVVSGTNLEPIPILGINTFP